MSALTPEQIAEHFIQAAVDSAPEPLRRLGEWLSNVLDEDEWKTADRMLAGAAIAAAEREAAHLAEIELERLTIGALKSTKRVVEFELVQTRDKLAGAEAAHLAEIERLTGERTGHLREFNDRNSALAAKVNAAEARVAKLVNAMNQIADGCCFNPVQFARARLAEDAALAPAKEGGS